MEGIDAGISNINSLLKNSFSQADPEPEKYPGLFVIDHECESHPYDCFSIREKTPYGRSQSAWKYSAIGGDGRNGWGTHARLSMNGRSIEGRLQRGLHVPLLTSRSSFFIGGILFFKSSATFPQYSITAFPPVTKSREAAPPQRTPPVISFSPSPV